MLELKCLVVGLKSYYAFINTIYDRRCHDIWSLLTQKCFCCMHLLIDPGNDLRKTSESMIFFYEKT